jgi:hypothetical protein
MDYDMELSSATMETLLTVMGAVAIEEQLNQITYEFEDQPHQRILVQSVLPDMNHQIHLLQMFELKFEQMGWDMEMSFEMTVTKSIMMDVEVIAWQLSSIKFELKAATLRLTPEVDAQMDSNQIQKPHLMSVLHKLRKGEGGDQDIKAMAECDLK